MELHDYLRVARAHWIGICLSVALGVMIALGWAAMQPKVYTADANGFLRSTNIDLGDQAGSSFLGDNLAKSKVKSYVELGSWRSIAEHAIRELGLNIKPEALVQRVDISNPMDTVIIEVTATGPTPEQARDLAGAWLRGMQAEILRIESGGDPRQTPAVQLDAADSARLPTAPSSPNFQLALAVGALIGMAVGAAYALLRYTLDRRVRSSAVVEAETGLTVIGTIPDERSFSSGNRLIPFNVGGRAVGKGGRDLHAISEAMRELRTNIQFLDVDNPPKIMVITSPLPGEGKSTTAANLALTLAASGQRVVLIDGDLRRSMLADVFSLPGEVGLTDVLAGRASIADVAQPAGPYGLLTVIAAGKIPPNPSELLGSERMNELVHGLADSAYVIIDAPPLIPVTDAAVLCHNTDGAILVATVGETTIDALQKAQGNLEKAGGRALGVVLNRVPRRGPASAYYGYQYRGDYYRSSREQAELPDAPPEVVAPVDSAAVLVARRAAQ